MNILKPTTVIIIYPCITYTKSKAHNACQATCYNLITSSAISIFLEYINLHTNPYTEISSNFI